MALDDAQADAGKLKERLQLAENDLMVRMHRVSLEIDQEKKFNILQYTVDDLDFTSRRRKSALSCHHA